jgi:hypothetical protein
MPCMVYTSTQKMESPCAFGMVNFYKKFSAVTSNFTTDQLMKDMGEQRGKFVPGTVFIFQEIYAHH